MRSRLLFMSVAALVACNATRAKIAVSSKVDNPKDYPEHLIDQKADTAWNGKTDDLVGGWIAFRVPKEAQVERIELTVGFDKVAKDGVDLFTANHRIKKVRVTRDGVLLGEPDLDVENRKPQSIKIDRPGGEYRVEVRQTIRGTKAEWRELVVSEFHVIGKTPRIERGIGESPRVLVGTLDGGEAPPRLAGSMNVWFPTIEALCAPSLPAARSWA